jgi:L-lactate dehydrogenase complex protein LldE
MRVALFVTCLVDLFRPNVGFAAIKLLEAAGCDVVVPDGQTCCGQPGYNSGDRASAQAVARRVLQAFAAYEYVVAPSGSCAGMIKTHYPELFKDEPSTLEQVQWLAKRTFELTDFLANVAKAKSLPAVFKGSVTYHDSCSGLRELGVQAQPRALLQDAGVPVKEMTNAATCCGFGGTFSVKLGDISSAMAEKKCAGALATGADAIVGGDLGCLLSIEGRLRRRGDDKTKVLHVAEVLAGDALT